ncbi:Nramp family divalent metal transporter [Colwellia sp. 4_MG-2023]|uniref:Nramp family divalent metal transporter n=1 Tax=unclassified Colwellia TaxID=196834 RepID=UPI0026E29869|nr:MULTISPECIES: Nramp family divalent metal transporter [unclassified Colwellia]MDO6506438.1 Nramp family divalent metal transporter [Colwellia sp. 5_MG-2023]MDO6555262.1 Nramp family divalent metal transporter [Colwellia sp. 4_MG-2023]
MKLPQIGPAFLVTAAFIGPGTVITASIAGADYGFALLWALLFSVLATLILQEMTARLGIVTQKGLGENIRQACTNPLLRGLAIALVLSAIVVGNSAYQSGNISGASLGLVGIFEDMGVKFSSAQTVFSILIGAIAFFLLISGSYKLIETALILLVSIMSLAFIITFLLTKPDVMVLLSGLFKPIIPDGATLTVIALIGSTIVPYNLFLHASSVSKKWQSIADLPQARKDLYISLPLGGLISMAILSTAATAFFGSQVSITSAADIAPALKPLFGDMASIFIGIGLFASGISSAVTAPLAAAFALSGILNSSKDLHSNSFKAIWIVVLFLGVLGSSLGYKPIAVIWFAQIANGILLPIVTIFLLWIMNTKVLGEHKNNIWQNTLGAIVVLVSLLLSGRSLMSAFGFL